MKLESYLHEVANTIAYWISKRGQVIEVSTNHIDVVIKNPSKFGITSKYIVDTYEKHGEEMGREGAAREEIILELVKNGWIRVRRYKNEGYSVNISRMTKKVKDILFDWANKLISTGIQGVKERDVYMPVNIIGFQDNFKRQLTIKAVAEDELFESGETFDVENKVVILESAGDLPDGDPLESTRS